MTSMTLSPAERLPRATLVPLLRLFDWVGIVEHSNGSEPDPTSGHCTDDAGRALGMAAQLHTDVAAEVIAECCLAQLRDSIVGRGSFCLRLDEYGIPTKDAPSDDATARALWGLSLAATRPLSTEISSTAGSVLEQFDRFASPYPRAAAHAVLAATILLEHDRNSEIGAQLLLRNMAAIPRHNPEGTWVWPEPRLGYSNALLPEALLAAGALLDDDRLVHDGLGLLTWLVEYERSDEGHFSFTPAGGRGPGGRPGFDQQPIEAWATADACARAHTLTGDPFWADSVMAAAAWFVGHNDVGVEMWDRTTGCAFDGLRRDGVNRNQGAESVLALIGALHAHERISTTAGRLETT
ncbi:MAG: glycosyltransferase [Actinobacteria bacterium]|nr:glycosyltransferase [Actinomycetota bacterium]